MADDRVTPLTHVAQRERIATEEGARTGAELLEHPPSQWPRLMRSDPRYRSFGTLRYLLAEARKRFDNEPSIAREITSAVLRFVEHAKGPSRLHEIGLRGLAWKEHANALEYTGDLNVALKAAKKSVATYAQSPSLQFDQTVARLVECNIYRDLGRTDRALVIARECALIFQGYAHSSYRTMALMSEGAVLIAQKQFADALTIFTQLAEQAEIEHDKETLARALHNTAECARGLDDHESARDLYARAIRHFDDLGMTTEATRGRWGLALSFAAEGKARTAISELFKVRAVYLHLGAHVSAATSGLDMVRVGFDAGEDVRELCSELVTTLTEAGLTQNAVEALAYLREQAKCERLTPRKIEAVRTYFGELHRKPMLLFARPHDGEEG